MTFTILASTLSAAITIAAGYRWRQSFRDSRWEGVSLLLLFFFILTFALAMATQSVSMMLFQPWSPSRLAPAIGWMHGYSIYSPPTGGPIQAVMCSPLGVLIYVPAVIFSTPTAQILAAGAIAHLFLATPLLVVHVRAAPADPRSRLLALIFGIGSYIALGISNISRYWLHNIYADAPALCFGLLACASLLPLDEKQMPGNRAISLSAIFAAFAVFSKQIDVVVGPALACLLWFIFGRPPAARYVSGFIGACLALLLLSLILFAPRSFFFNVFTIPSHQPLIPLRWSAAARFLVRFLIPTLVVLVGGFFAYSRRLIDFTNPRRALCHPSGLLLFVVIALIPTSILGRLKVGGEDNSLHFYYYLIPAISILFLRTLTSLSRPRFRQPDLMTLCAALFFVSYLARIGLRLEWNWPTKETFTKNPNAVSFAFSKHHPNEAYFPFDPLVTLMSEGKLYHFDFGIFDRKIAGFPVSEQNYRAFLPSNLKWIVVWKTMERSYETFETPRRLPEFRFAVTDPDAPGILLFAKH